MNSDETVSRSQLKRDARELFDLGRELVALSPAQLAKVPLPEPVLQAVDEARRIKSHVAHKRQLQFLAKKLRAVDSEPIYLAMAQLRGLAAEDRLRQHRLEAWREALLTEGQKALNQLTGLRPAADRQLLRSLMRKAQQEQDRNKPPTASRKLFRSLREIDDQEPLPPPN